MELKSCPLLFSVLLILVASFHYQVSAVSPPPPPIVGGYQPIKNLNSKEVLEIARFAVSEYNKQHDAKLQFVKVVKGDYQIVSGVNYKLVINVIDTAVGNLPANYEAVVYDKPWEGIRKLISFVSRPLLGGYQLIENLNSKEVLDIARFAVSEYNKQHDAKLQFVKVLKGYYQIVAGVNYRLAINVIDTAAGNAPANYVAAVYDIPWEGKRQLTSFVKLKLV